MIATSGVPGWGHSVRGVGGEIRWCRQPDGSGKAVWAQLPVIAADVGRGPVFGPPVQHDC